MSTQGTTKAREGSVIGKLGIVLMTAGFVLCGGRTIIAASDTLMVEGPAGDAVAENWTSDRLKRAEPLPLPLSGPGFRPLQALPEETSSSGEPSLGSPAQPPSVKVRAHRRKLFEPDPPSAEGSG